MQKDTDSHRAIGNTNHYVPAKISVLPRRFSIFPKHYRGSEQLQRLKEFYRGGDDDRYSPAAGKQPSRITQFTLTGIRQKIRYDSFVSIRTLLCQCQERKDKNDPIHGIPGITMPDSKVKQCQCLAGTGGSGEGKDARRHQRCGAAGVENL